MTLRTYLQDELVRRCKTNPRYSLRSFAKHLQINPSLLSKILRGHVGVSRKRFEKFCDRMGLSPTERAQFAKAEAQKQTLKKQDTLFRELKNTSSQLRDMADRFQVIAEWYHYAILELSRLDDFQPDERWIAKTLGITYPEAFEARERLERLGMLKVNDDGKWMDISGALIRSGHDPSAALRRLQAQVLNLAINALEVVPDDQRLQASMTVAMDAKLVASAKEKMIAFQQALVSSLVAESKTKNAVYQITASLFPLASLEAPDQTL